MFSRFFIDRPIFAAVISILITLAGAIAGYSLPLAQYPPITPPTVQVDCTYPGASAEVVAESVASPIEQQVNGVEEMLYMTSQSTNDGAYSLTVTMKPGVNLNLAQVMVQNRVDLAIPSLPDVVRQTGVTTRKRSPDILMTISLYSPHGRYDQLYLSNYATLRIADELLRVPGVSEVRVFGQRDYSMRIWLDPEKLAIRNLSATDVTAALREQNAAVAVGQVGQPPTEGGPAEQIPLDIRGRLSSPEEFGDVILRATPDGKFLRIKDVGRVELGARNNDTANRFDGRPTVGLAIFPLSDANALDMADAVKAKMTELQRDFPDDMTFEVGYDTTPFIRESVQEVFKALRDAVLLVALVVLVFLQGWRPSIIPLIAVPVAIIGTFAAMAVVGFSLNNLTLFGLVLAIGIVVDDAIVVVEAVEYHIEHGMAPRDAAIAAMHEVAGPVIAVGLVLSAVFVPCAFMSGIVGQFFRQFALTIAISTVISTINSLTLSPALSALLLRPRKAQGEEVLPRVGFLAVGACAGAWLLAPLVEHWLAPAIAYLPAAARPWWPWILGAVCGAAAFGLGGWINVGLTAVFGLFNSGMKQSTRAYTFTVGKMLRVPLLVLAVYGGLVLLTQWGMHQLPRGFIPTQDKGYLVASVQLPDAASDERMQDVMRRLERIIKATPGVKNVNSISGNSFTLGARGPNFGNMFIILKSFAQRRTPDVSAGAIIGKLKKQLAAEVPEATVTVFPPPAVSGLGKAGGFKFMLEDRGDLGLEELQRQTDNLMKKASAERGLTGLLTVFKNDAPQLLVDVDRDACLSQGVGLSEVFGTLQSYLGSRYVNDFNLYGRTWQVIVQADAPYRNEIEDVKKLRVRGAKGKMVPLGALISIKSVAGPLVLTRYNMYPAAPINGNVIQGLSTGQGIELMEQVARRELPQKMSFEWTELAYLERTSGDTGMIVVMFSVVFVFLVLAALYESWSLPLAVILVVPMCVLCSIAGVAMAKLDINIFTQVGFVVLIGLACKNAILIVEFAKLRRDHGVPAREAVIEACKLRLRPILMTSFAFILGVLPLAAATGAGAEMRRALGTAVFSGMLGVTLFGIFLTPVFFVLVDQVAHIPAFARGWIGKIGAAVLLPISIRRWPGYAAALVPAKWKQDLRRPARPITTAPLAPKPAPTEPAPVNPAPAKSAPVEPESAEPMVAELVPPERGPASPHINGAANGTVNGTGSNGSAAKHLNGAVPPRVPR